MAGEDSGGVHGANRLGGNGVAESTVFGAIAGDAMAEFVVDRTLPAVDQREVEAAVIAAMGPFGGTGSENIFSIRQEIESLMWDKGGIVRNGPDLESVIASLEELGRRAEQAPVPAVRQYNQAWHEWLDVRSIMTVAQVTCLSALARRESRGSHYRSDYPESNDHDWLCNVLIRQGSQARADVWQEGVEFTRMRPGGSDGQ